MIRLSPLGQETVAVLAAPLSQLHSVCFPDDPWPPQAMAEIISMPGVFGRLACAGEAAADDGSASGLALAHHLGPECELLTLGVVPTRRRTGIGRALLTAVIDEAGQHGAHTLFLEVAEDNVAARALYDACGFVQIGRRANYYRRRAGLADALVLRLLLAI
jgi:[ribosomal protein S18]-alanine N-acetyltransferase